MTVVTILIVIGVFCLLILSHEFGHFIVAKACGVYVEDFSLGMGPKLFQIKGKETTYTLRLLPIGGWCNMRGEDEDRLRGLGLGADDYMVKPIDLDELLLRVEALLRRAKIATSKKLTVGSLTLDAEEHTAYFLDEEIPLTVREFNLIYKLLSYPKKTFTRSQLMDEFWEGDSSSGPRTVDVYITKLRSKFAECDDFEIVTVHGLGYKAVLK